MNTTANESTAKPAEDFTRTWRYKVGLFMIIAGNAIIVLGLFMPMLGFGAAVVGAMVVGGEIISLGSIVFLGKEGFKAIKAKVFGVVKAGHRADIQADRARGNHKVSALQRSVSERVDLRCGGLITSGLRRDGRGCRRESPPV